MNSLFNLVGGGAIVAVWKLIPGVVKVPMIFGAGMLAAVELNKDMNESWFSRHIFGGQAAQGEAQIVDPAVTQKAIQTGQRVTGAAATVAAQYQGLSADAKQKEAYADAASESEDEIMAKLKAKNASPQPNNCGLSSCNRQGRTTLQKRPRPKRHSSRLGFSSHSPNRIRHSSSP